MLKLAWNKTVLKAAIRGDEGKLFKAGGRSILVVFAFELSVPVGPATHDRAHVLVRARHRHTPPLLHTAAMLPTTMATPPSAVTVPATRARRGLVLVGQALVLATLLLAGVAALAGSPGGGASPRRPAPRRALLFSLSGGRAAHRTLTGAGGEQKR
jgi:hypothetical protein